MRAERIGDQMSNFVVGIFLLEQNEFLSIESIQLKRKNIMKVRLDCLIHTCDFCFVLNLSSRLLL